MEKNKKIIIITIVAAILIIAAGAYVAFNMNGYEKKTIEIFENGTSLEVPSNVELTNRSEVAVSFADANNTTMVFGFRYDDAENPLNVNEFVEKLVDAVIYNLTDKAELQDNGVFKLSAEERKKMAAQNGINTKDKDDAKDLYIGILKNESLNQTIIIASEDEQYVVDMMDSIKWKASLKTASNETDNATVIAQPVQVEDNDTDEDLDEVDMSEENEQEEVIEEEPYYVEEDPFEDVSYDEGSGSDSYN